jgi:glutathione-regulated potassium-efflux system ancillary protein KefG
VSKGIDLEIVTPTVRTEDLADAQELATLLGLRHPNSVSTYQRRYPDMPKPVLDLGPGRPKLWLRPHVSAWAEARRRS